MYVWQAVNEMKAAGSTETTVTLAQLEMWQSHAKEVADERDRLIEWSNTIADRMPSSYDGDEGQEALINHWLDDLTGAVRSVLVRSEPLQASLDRSDQGLVPVGLVAEYVGAIVNALTPVLEGVR